MIRIYGEERFSRQIARAIVQARETTAITRTGELADLIARTIPRAKHDPKQHPATRSFQAIRIHINGELDELTDAMRQAGRLLNAGGHLAIISFHSLEDRLVKHFFEAGAHPERRIDTRIALRAQDMPQPWWADVRRISQAERSVRIMHGRAVPSCVLVCVLKESGGRRGGCVVRTSWAIISERVMQTVAFISAIVLLLSAGALVTTQYRVRVLFVEIERANEAARRLMDDSSQLALDLSKAALPAAVSSRAKKMGFETQTLHEQFCWELNRASFCPSGWRSGK